jgi:hypothetical protein
MPAKVLTNTTALTDEQVDAAHAKLPPLPDNVTLIVRHLQAQITDLTARVEALEP